jgi:DNA mismatch repair protein MutL
MYLNGRAIRDRFIQHAIKEAYRGLMEPGRQPAAILMIDMPPGDVDVNVHPTKAEVRFKDSGRIHGLVLSGIREKLLGSDLTPKARPEVDDQQSLGMREKLAEFLRAGGSAPATSLAPTSPSQWTLHTPPQQPPMNWPVGAGSPRPPLLIQTAPTQSHNESPQIPAMRQATEDAHPIATAAKLPAMQLHNSYLVTESEDGLIIIDQHALHERIMYEELLARMQRGPLESQHLLIPEVVKA